MVIRELQDLKREVLRLKEELERLKEELSSLGAAKEELTLSKQMGFLRNLWNRVKDTVTGWWSALVDGLREGADELERINEEGETMKEARRIDKIVDRILAGDLD